jgi:hypothetical protein
VQRALQVLVVALAAHGIGCGSPEEAGDLPDDVVWESAHFRYHTRAEDTSACSSVLEELERHFATMQEYLGFQWSGTHKVEYYKFSDVDDFRRNSGCPAGAGGCARGSSVLTPNVLHPHELIHAYLAPLGLAPAFFVEGIATVLDCDHAWAIDPRPFEEVVALPYGNDRVHVEGPWFAGYLLHEFGPERYLSLYARLDYTASLAKIGTVFEETYGEPLAAIWEAAKASSRRVRCNHLWACGLPSTPLDGEPRTLRRACDGTDVFRTFELDAPRDLLLAPAGHFLFAPLSCDEELPYAIGGDAPQGDMTTLTSIAPVSPGRYFVAPWEQSAEVRLRTLPSNSFSLDCAGAEPVDLGTEDFFDSHFQLAIPNEDRPWFVKLRPAPLDSVFTSDNGALRVERCSSCSGDTSCEQVEHLEATDPDGSILLRLTPASPGPGYVASIFQLSAARLAE